MMKEKINFKDLTFIIPVRLDSIPRIENLRVSTDHILNNFNTNIYILEAAAINNCLLKKYLSSKVSILFVEDKDPVFHRTKYINTLVEKSKTQFLAIWDSDVLVSPKQLVESIKKLREDIADFVFPYSGFFVDTGFEFRDTFIKRKKLSVLKKGIENMIAPYGFSACGGGFLVNKKKYQAAGMENANFYGWGFEDGERVKRWEILGLRMDKVKGPMFHLSHPRGLNSAHRSEDARKQGLKEFLRICKMTKEELQKEIETWTI